MSAAARHVLGERLAGCRGAPRTGFYHDRVWRTGAEHVGRHVVCAVMTESNKPEENMQPLNPLDQTFLRLESRHQPMHVGGLQLFKLPRDAADDYVRNLVATARSRTDVQPPFNQCLKYRFGLPFWTDDTSFDLEYHVRHLALPAPGAIRDLFALVSFLHSALLDRSRPLWEAYVIEGVEDDRIAVYTKFHHAMMDGVSAMRTMTRALSPDPDSTELMVPWQPRTNASAHRSSSRPSSLNLAWQALRAATRQVTALPRAGSELYQAWRDAYGDPDFTTPLQAPRCMLNQKISGSRRFAAQAYSLERVKRLARHYEGTVNDIVLAMCASALRRYLIDHDGLPDAPLTTMVPVSLDDGSGDSGNRVAVILASLATDIEDPIERLNTIKRSVNHWKQRYKTMSDEQIMAFIGALSAPAGINLATGLAPERQAFNIVISNVPGPDKPLYLAGAKQEGMYPVSIVIDGQALNITITSYNGELEFGLLACRRAVPSMQRLLDYLADALDELEPRAADDQASANGVAAQAG